MDSKPNISAFKKEIVSSLSSFIFRHEISPNLPFKPHSFLSSGLTQMIADKDVVWNNVVKFVSKDIHPDYFSSYEFYESLPVFSLVSDYINLTNISRSLAKKANLSDFDVNKIFQIPSDFKQEFNSKNNLDFFNYFLNYGSNIGALFQYNLLLLSPNLDVNLTDMSESLKVKPTNFDLMKGAYLACAIGALNHPLNIRKYVFNKNASSVELKKQPAYPLSNILADISTYISTSQSQTIQSKLDVSNMLPDSKPFNPFIKS